MEPKFLNININKNQIERSTGRAYLIKMPHNSDYDGFTFWFPSKLVNEGRHDAALRLCIPASFNFTLKRTSPKTYKVLDEAELSAHQLVDQFRQTDENIQGSDVAYTTEVERVEAPEVKIDHIEIPEDLQND